MKKKYEMGYPRIDRIKRLLRIMKIAVALLLVFTIGANANSFGQKTTVSFTMKNTSIAEVLNRLEKETGYHFFIQEESSELTQKVDVNYSDVSIMNALDELLDKTGLGFRVIDNYIAIIKTETSANMPMQQGSITINGVVTDSNGDPLPGVNVYEKGNPTKGVITGIDGNYSINVSSADVILLYSYIGFDDQEVNVAGRTEVNITLLEEFTDLDEVIVVGYGTKARTSVTGAVEVADSKLLTRKANTNAMSAIATTLPGLAVTRNSGRVGDEGYSFSIRGLTSVNNNNVQPLVVIDGVPGDYEQLELMNPEDIKNVVLLKDASAAIYGARAAQGVILVTTKNGVRGKMTVSYKADWNMKTIGLYPEKASMNEHAKFGIQGFENDGNFNSPMHAFKDYVDTPYDETKTIQGPFGQTTPAVKWMNNDWVDAMWKNASTVNHNVSLSGGNEKSIYYFSLGYLKENSPLKFGENNHERYNMKLKHTYNVTNKFQIHSNVVLGWRELVEPTLLNDALSEITRVWGCAPVYAENGMFFQFADFQAPAASLELGGESTNKKLTVNLDLKAIYTFDKALEGLKATFAFGMNDVQSVTRNYLKQYYTHNNEYEWLSPNTRRYKSSRAQNFLWENTFKNYSFYLNYDKNIGEDHDINAMLGASQEENLYEHFNATRWNMLNDDLHTLNLGDPNQMENTGGGNEWALRSFFARAGYSYKQKYSAEFIFRRDGSSKFVDDKRYKNFYGVLGSYNISNEDFIRDLGVFDNLKLRLSYGESGYQGGIGLYDYIQLINLNGEYPMGINDSRGSRARLGGMVSETRTWETIATSNIGLDVGVLNNRLTANIDFFKKENKNMLLSVTYPEVLGGTPPKTNNGSLETVGYEIALNWSDRIGNFNYYIGASLQDDKNKITDLAGAENRGVGIVKTKEGYALNSVWVYQYDGILKTQEEVDAYKEIERVNPNLIVGDVRIKDLDGDGRIFPYENEETGDKGDLVHIGDLNPRYRFNFRLGGSYKNIDFSATFTGVGKQLTQLSRQWDMMPGSAFWVSPFKYFVDNTYSAENPNGRFGAAAQAWGSPRFGWNYQQSTLMYQEIWWMKLNDIQIGYTLTPKNVPLLERIGVQQMRIFANGKDVTEWSNIADGFDPEVGYKVNHYPFMRYYGGGVQITF